MMELQRCVFYHNNKTGGDWIKNALRRTCTVVKELDIHCNLGYYNNFSKPSFAFVRHPVEIYESVYHYYRKKNMYNAPCYMFWAFPKYVHLPFNEYVEVLTTKHHQWLSNYCKLFLEGIDYIGRTENLPDDLFKILDAVGEPYDKEVIMNTPISNVGNYHSKVEMTPYLRGLIECSESGLIDKFYTK